MRDSPQIRRSRVIARAAVILQEYLDERRHE